MPNLLRKLGKFTFLSLVFLLVTSTVFFGIHWFSRSLADMIIRNNSLLPSSLENTVDNALASTKVSELSPPAERMAAGDFSLQAEAGLAVKIGPEDQIILFEKDKNQKLPIASLTKLMTALVVLENYSMDQNITISTSAMAQEGEQGELQLGQTFSAKNLLYSTLMESNNRAAYALSEVLGTDAFVVLMNVEAEKLGLKHTHFADVAGLDARSYSTASDLATLTKYLFENYPLFGQIIGLKEYDLYTATDFFHHKIRNTNIFLGQRNVIGGKTGFTIEAQGCFMVLQKSETQDNYTISIILGAQDRFLQMQRMMDWVKG